MFTTFDGNRTKVLWDDVYRYYIYLDLWYYFSFPGNNNVDRLLAFSKVRFSFDSQRSE